MDLSVKLQPLILPRDDFSPMTFEEPSESYFGKWGTRLFTGLVAGASLVGRAVNWSPITNALSSFGVGFGVQACVDHFLTDQTRFTAKRIALTAFGQISSFFLTQLYANTESLEWQTVASSTIVGMLGAVCSIYISQIGERPMIRIETPAIGSKEEGEKFTGIFFNQGLSDALKGIVAGGLGAGYFLTDDPVFRGLFSFGALFYGAEILGQRVSTYLDQSIVRNEMDASGLMELTGSRYRLAKTVLNTIGFFAIPFSFIPFDGDAHSAARISQLFIVGAVAGFFDGMMFRSEEDRLQRIPIHKLEELHLYAPIKNLASRIYEIVVVLGMTSFVAWQEGWELDDPYDQAALGAVFGAFMGTLGIVKYIDLNWDLETRISQPIQTLASRIKDKLLCSLLITPRLLGINPAYLFLVGTNALMMDDRAIADQSNDPYRAVIVGSWAAFGVAMAIELERTSSPRIGTVCQFPLLVVINGVLTMERMARGSIE